MPEPEHPKRVPTKLERTLAAGVASLAVTGAGVAVHEVAQAQAEHVETQFVDADEALRKIDTLTRHGLSYLEAYNKAKPEEKGFALGLLLETLQELDASIGRTGSPKKIIDDLFEKTDWPKPPTTRVCIPKSLASEMVTNLEKLDKERSSVFQFADTNFGDTMKTYTDNQNASTGGPHGSMYSDGYRPQSE